MTTPSPRPNGPTTEVGYSTSGGPQPGWAAWIDPQEEVAALTWPLSNHTYHKMRTDSQIDALLRGVFLPVRRRHWRLDPNGCRDEVLEMISTDLGVPIVGEVKPLGRGRRRFSHDDHLRHALLAVVYGHMYFEQNGIIDDALAWRLRKLGPRLPNTIMKIDVARDGGLESIRQYGAWDQKPIPVTSLVAYIWEREGGNWLGRSMLRSLYRHWLVKDRLIRIDALKNERYGIGIPTGTAPPGARDVAHYGALASQIRAGESSGVGLPNGATVGVEGIKGVLPDTIGSIKYHDEAMARAFLEMFIQLGTTQTGSRALGKTFVDFFDMSLDTICDWYAGVTNEHVIEDIVDYNWGEDEAAPLLIWEGDDEDEPLAVADLIALIDAGLLTVDPEMEDWIRARHNMPELTDETRAAIAAAQAAANALPAPAPDNVTALVAAGSKRREVIRASSQTIAKPEIGHREPNDHEVKAGTDFGKLQTAWQDTTTSLVNDWAAVRAEQINALVDAVAASVEAGDVSSLASLAAPVLGADAIGDAMVVAAEQAVTDARAEAAAQGVTIDLINIADLEASIRARAGAVAVLMSRSISETAARAALLRYGVEAMSAADVADGVRTHLADLTDTYLNDQLGGAITQAQNTGRFAVMGQAPATYYASELLDSNTCEECAAADGRAYASLDEAEQDYPTGGYGECDGGPRCRGTVVAVYDEAEPSE